MKDSELPFAYILADTIRWIFFTYEKLRYSPALTLEKLLDLD